MWGVGDFVDIAPAPILIIFKRLGVKEWPHLYKELIMTEEFMDQPSCVTYVEKRSFMVKSMTPMILFAYV